jgi:GTP-binding protein EngB required for normal cell division
MPDGSFPARGVIGMTSDSDAIALPAAQSPPEPGAAHRNADAIADLIGAAARLPLPETPAVAHAQTQLQSLAQRLAQGRFQLAVVGQFKRGKSTLLNALLGAEVLPAAVTPLTAIATFIRNGPALRLLAERDDGGREMCDAPDIATLKELLAARVTEDGNPQNRLGLARVEIELPAALLGEGIVLIDTPGVGSIYRHNTQAARAALPECDAALFVVSPDPPITETETAYLQELRVVTSNIVVVLNKIDLVAGDDRARSEEFLAGAVGRIVGDMQTKFFSLSARAALDAKRDGNARALESSGLPALETYLTEFARTKRHAALERAVSHKAAAFVRELIFAMDLGLAAYRMPLDDLSARLAQFAQSEGEFAKERDTSHDILAGDRKRILDDLDSKAGALRDRMQQFLRREAEMQIARRDSETEIVGHLRARIPQLFQPEFEAFEAEFRRLLEALLVAHQVRADELISKVRQAASSLLDIPFTAPPAEDAFQSRKTPYWVTSPRESLAVLPKGIFDAIVPKGMRIRRLRTRLARRTDEIIARNVENLRWSIRQNLEETVRLFQAQLDERLRLSQEATREAMRRALERRTGAETGSREDVAHLTRLKERLSAIAANLEAQA